MSSNKLQTAEEFLQRGDRLAARDLLNSLLVKQPDDLHALHLMSTIEMEDGNPESAQGLIQRVLALEPTHSPALYNLGVCQMKLGNRTDALDTFNKALAVDPAHSGALYNVGYLLSESGQAAQASTFFARLVKVNPGWISAWEAYCECLMIELRFHDVIAACNLLVRQSKANHRIYRFRGDAQLGLGNLQDAESSYILSFRSNELDPDTLMHLAMGFRLLGKPKESIPVYERVLVIAAQNEPFRDRFDSALSELILACREQGDWTRLKVYEEQAISRLANDNGSIHPHVILQISDDRSLALKSARNQWQLAPNEIPAASVVKSKESDVIRIGVMSSTFGDNPTTDLITSVISKSGREKFVFFAYNAGPLGSASEQLKSSCEILRNVSTTGDEGLAGLIRSDGLDLLINNMGFERHSRISVLKYRPSPLVANYSSFPGSMGTKLVDYLIADPVLVPNGDEEFFDECIVRLPDSYRAIRPSAEPPGEARSRESLGLKESATIFAVFGDISAIGPKTVDLYAAILRGTPNGCLWLVCDNLAVRANLRVQFEARGVQGDRLAFTNSASPKDQVELMKRADLALDTFPLSRQTSVRTALIAGVPILTRKGGNFASRSGASLLTAASLPELIAEDDVSFVQMAIDLASNKQQHSDLRSRMANLKDRSPLFSFNRLRRHLEVALEMMVDRHRKGLPPASFNVPSLQ